MKQENSDSKICPVCGRPTHKQSKYCIFHASAEEKTEEEFKNALNKYVNKIKKENGDYDFKEFIFVGSINFKEDLNITIFKNADFKKAIFEKYAFFGGVTFEGEANFSKVVFKKAANFHDTVFKGNANFEKAVFSFKEEKSEKELKDALKKHMNDNKKKYGKYDFEKVINKFEFYTKVRFDFATFERNVDFSFVSLKGSISFFKANFKGISFFYHATFEEEVNFSYTNFEGINFSGIVFMRETDFSNANFKENADFGGVIFKERVDFVDTSFENGVDFSESTFKGQVSFSGTTIRDFTDFNGATFEGSAGFFHSTFKGSTFFLGTTFKDTIEFHSVTFERDATFQLNLLTKKLDFSGIHVFPGSNFLLKVDCSEIQISFESAHLENIRLELYLLNFPLLNFTNAILKNTYIKKQQIENHILQEKKKEFSKSQEIYLLLKNNFHSIGRYEDENWAFKKEKDMERKSNCHFKTLHKWIWSCFLNGIFGYGIQPFKVIMSAILIITLFAFLFTTSGISNLGTEQIISNSFFDCMYFSTITFTTLGYGDFRPLEGWGRILAGSEAFIGAFMMALFVYTFARRTGGR